LDNKNKDDGQRRYEVKRFKECEVKEVEEVKEGQRRSKDEPDKGAD
jgi:hypothetical protein